MKTKWKVIIAVILAVVISVGSISAYKYITSPKEESIPLETTLEDAAELTTQKMIISDVFKSTKGNIIHHGDALTLSVQEPVRWISDMDSFMWINIMMEQETCLEERKILSSGIKKLFQPTVKILIS